MLQAFSVWSLQLMPASLVSCRLPRRKFLVTMYSVELILRSINVGCYLVPNVYSLVHPCDWGGAVIAWTAAAR